MVIIANWKMNLSADESIQATQTLNHLLLAESSDYNKENTVKIVICPSFIAMREVARFVSGSKMMLGAQDMSWETKGAFTGDSSAYDLHNTGCRYVLLGHSERRRYHHETNQEIQKKIQLCVRSGMNPVVCVGETAEERREGKSQAIMSNQIRECLRGVKLLTTTELIVAYEPVWAIGAGTPASTEDVRLAASTIRNELFDMGIAKERSCVIYGGSVSSDHIRDYVGAGTDGFLVGGQSNDPHRFFEIIKAARESDRRLKHESLV